MKSTALSPQKSLVLALLGCGAIFTQASAIVLTDPTLHSTIETSDGRAIVSVGSGATSVADLQALQGFGSIHDYTGFTAGTNIINFTQNHLPDVRVSLSGAIHQNTGAEVLNPGFTTSPTSAIRVGSNNAATARSIVGTIDFGSWDGSTFSTGSGAVSAAGFTLAGPAAQLPPLGSIVVRFLDDNGIALSTQSITSFPNVNQGIYFGYATDGARSISSIEFTVNINASTDGTNALTLGLDGISFVAIPEPSTFAYGGILAGVLLGLHMLRRRKRN